MSRRKTNLHAARRIMAGRAISRRRLLGGLLLGAAAGVSALQPGPAAAASAAEIDAAVAAARDTLFQTREGARELYARASGVLIIPDVFKAGLVVGGAYGEGSLNVAGENYGYWSYFSASIGAQLGGQSASQALFFMTPQALNKFTTGSSFEIGVDAEATVLDAGAELSLDSTKDMEPIIVIVFDRSGFLGGASLQGGRYSRFTP